MSEDKIGKMFDCSGLVAFLSEEYGLLEERVRKGKGTLVDATLPPKKRERFGRMLREFINRQEYLVRVYLFLRLLPGYILHPELAFGQLVQVVISPPAECLGFIGDGERDRYAHASGAGTLQQELLDLMDFPMDYDYSNNVKFYQDLLTVIRKAVEFNFSRRDEVFTVKLADSA